MDNGNMGPETSVQTASPMTPVPSEDEMTKLQDIFRRAAQAIVDVSGLSAKVTELTTLVDSLKAEIEHVRDRNRWLDQELEEVRKARNEAQDRALTSDRSLREAQGTIETLTSHVDKSQARINELEQSLDTISRARDDAELRVMELEDKLKAAEGRYAKVRQFALDEFGFREADQETKAEPSGVPDYISSGYTDTSTVPTNPDPEPKADDNDKPWWMKDQA